MTTDFCTPIEVASHCNFVGSNGERAVWGTNPQVPTFEEVEAFINDAEEEIEQFCMQTWGNRTIQILEQYHDIYPMGAEVSIHLEHCNIVTFATGEGDKLEIWQNNSWVDWIATYSEGRGDDFFVDYELGKIYFNKRKPPSGEYRCKVTYRYNSGDVPKPIKRACIYLVGIIIANTPSGLTFFVEGQESKDVQRILDRWQDYIDNQLKRHQLSVDTTNLKFYPTMG